MKFILKIMVLLILLASISLWGQSVGTTSFEFLKNQYSARGAAIGGNLMAIKGDVNAVFYNPAALSALDVRQWTVNYVDHLLDFQGGQLAYAQKNPLLGTWGIGLLYFNYGDFQETDKFGQETGREFSAAEFALAFVTANQLGGGFDYGLNVKFIYSSIEDYNASALALDAGLIYTIPQLDDLQLGISLSNAGAVLDNYAAADETLPLNLRFGFAKQLQHLPLTITGALNDLTMETGDFWDRLQRFSIGGEFDVSEVIKLRLGYDNDVNRSVKPLEQGNFGGLSGGLGIAWKQFRLDYAHSTYGDLGSQNRIGVTGTF